VTAGCVGLLLLLAAAPAPPQGRERVIDVRGVRPAAGNTFEALWAAYRKSEKARDLEKSQEIFREIRRYRIERNVKSLEEVSLTCVGNGLAALKNGELDAAASAFRGATEMDPYLPDGHLGLAKTSLEKGPLGLLPAATSTLAGLAARLPTLRGQIYLYSLLVPVTLVGLLAAVTVMAFALVLRHGALLKHDLEESFGSRGASTPVALYAILLFLPLLTFQGWAWMPLWWLALLFVYLSRSEMVVCLAVLLSTLLVVPLVRTLDAQLLAMENPLFRASVLAIEGGPDQRAIDDLEHASQATAEDKDLLYLLALQYKKAGRYDEAAGLYRDLLKANATDPIALNNLANIEFARAEPQAAIARYKQGIEAAPENDIQATYYYNLSLAHLQRFEYQPHQEARSQADRLAPSLVSEYESLWKYGESAAVVDLALSQEQVFAKFAEKRSGIGRKNVWGTKVAGLMPRLSPGDFVNRFSAFIGLAVAVALGISQWRGKRMFTMRCPKCGTPFCKRCHLGAATSGLCTQCYHLFVVRDGVSGPARNQKLLEVQKEDERRERLFRVLSLISPGAGHVYAQSVAVGLLLLLAWYWVLSMLLLAGRVVPVTEAPEALLPRWPMFLGGAALLVIYVLANRARPDFDVAVPVKRSAPMRRA
jgi:tetratricopeptide (TPR) repeat protein